MNVTITLADALSCLPKTQPATTACPACGRTVERRGPVVAYHEKRNGDGCDGSGEYVRDSRRQ